MVLPFGTPKKVQAARFDEVFRLNQNNKPSESVFTPERYMTNDLRLEPKSKAKDGFQLVARMTLRGDDAKDSDEDDKFTKDDTKGAWDVVLDSDMGRSGENGIFLFVGKEKITVRNEDKSSPPDFDEYTDRVIGPRTARLQIPASLQGAIKSSDIPYYSSDNVDPEIPGGKVNGLNIGPIIWEINPDIFFSNSRAPSPTITVTGLEPDTTYYAQLAAVEDKGTRIALSDILTITTGSTTDPATVDLGGTGLNANDQTDAPQDDANTPNILKDIKCNAFPTTWGGCFVHLSYWIFYIPSTFISSLSGRLFDTFVNIALGSSMYREPAAAFVVGGWAIVRDIANVFFIFILLYIALGLVLSLHHFDAKKLISKVVIIALLINFSLFFTRAVVDTSNILALVFYNSIDITYNGTDKEVTKGEKKISLAVTRGVGPQAILSSGVVDSIEISAGTGFFIILLSTILNLVLAWVFFTSAAFFAGRIGVIWLSMVFAPLALVSSIIPGLDKGLKQIGWSQWLSAFLKACFNAPIFIFFLYLIVRFVSDTDIFTGILSSGDNVGWSGILVGVLLPAMILIGLLMAAKKIAEEMAGQFGAAFTGLINGAIGGTANVAMGGAAMLGRKLVGGAAAKTLQNQDLRDAASGNVARLKEMQAKGMYKNYNFDRKEDVAKAQKEAGGKLKRADTLSKASFDVRQTGAANMLSSVTGVNMNAGAGIIPGLGAFGVDNTAGGFAASQQRKVEKENAFKALLGQNDDKIHNKEHENEEIDQALVPHQEKLKKQEGEKTEAEDAIKKWKNENPNKPVPQPLIARLDKANKDIKDTKENTVVTTANGTKYAGINGAEKNKKENEKEIEKLKSELAKSYVKFVQDQARPGDMVGEINNAGQSSLARKLQEDLRNGLRGALKGMALGGAAGGLFAGVGAVPGALVGSIAGAISGGIRPGMKNLFHSSTDTLSEGLSTIGQKIGGVGGTTFDKNVNWSGRVKSADEEVGETLGHKEQHTHKFKATYKTPNSNFFKMFEGLGKSSGGGASHDAGGDHGGGGDHH